MEAVLDFTRPLDVRILDQVVSVFYDASNPQRGAADKVLMAFKEHPEAWTRVDAILESTASANTKYIALQILEGLIKFRWKTLPTEQREGIRTYLVQKIITLAQDERTLRGESVLVNKLNLLLVQVLKHEWPGNWPSFIPDIVGSSKTSEVLCENHVTILRLLSEEVFDFSKESLTAAKADALKASLHTQLAGIFELFDFVLQAGSRPSLINATLQTLQRYVTWIPDSYIFETRLLETLILKYLPRAEFRVGTLQVLAEVGSLAKPAYDRVFEQLYLGVMGQLVRFLPSDVSLKRAYEDGSQADQLFLRHLALFLTGFFRVHAELLEPEPFRPVLLAGMGYLVQISDVSDTEVFKICLEYWLRLANDLYALEVTYNPTLPALGGQAGGAFPGIPGGTYVDPVTGQTRSAPLAGASSSASSANPRKKIYAEVLSRVREVMIAHMAKPEEVLIEEDDSGEIVRETTKDTDALAVYKVMKDTLVYLTHLDTQDTENIMLDKLAKQVDVPASGSLNWDALNTLCWAMGSISGTMSETDEKRFLVTVIKDLLGMCEAARGKNNKAVVASNIMYVVGQYPRFLKAHWKFLRTVVLKLFEFMHEKHPGVQDMAVDTFLKIAQKCRRKFATQQPGENVLFVDELTAMLPNIIADLEAHQVHGFYEACGHMVSALPTPGAREAATERLMALPNQSWQRVMRMAVEGLDALRSPDNLKDLQRVLRTNAAACRSIGPSFAGQLAKLYLDMLNLYKAVSGFISAAIAASGEGVTQTTAVKAMRSVKKEVLNLVSTFVSRSEDPRFVCAHFIPPLLEPVLGDYAASHPAGRDPEVLNLMAEIVNKLRGDILPDTPRILEAVFEPTLGMITANFSDFPEHRLAFFRLLEAINYHCFPALFRIPPAHQKLVVDAVVWAFKHTERNIGEMGLNILASLLENVAAAGPDIAQPFYAGFFLPLLGDLLGVLTDRLHRAHFKLHAGILRHLCHLVEGGAVSTPLWESPHAQTVGAAAMYQAKVQAAAAAAGGAVPPGAASNQQFVRDYIRTMVATAFPNLKAPTVASFAEGLFDMTRDVKAVKQHLRDFLLLVQEFKGEEEGDVFAAEERSDAAAAAAAAEAERRKAVPGLMNPYEAPGADLDDL